MFYPHADDENVAMGYANYNHKERTTMVTIDNNAFKTYMFANYISKLDRVALMALLEEQVDQATLVGMAQNIWELPFEVIDGKVSLVNADALLMAHSVPPEEEECYDCPDLHDGASPWNGEDYDLISYNNADEEFAPYDEYDENL